MKRVESKAFYEKAEQCVTFGTKIAILGLIINPSVTGSSIIVAAYHWYLGIYTTKSWSFDFPVW